MSGLTSITDHFCDGVHTLALPLGPLEELQERTGVGPAMLLGRLLDGTWRVSDVRETIRLALIGGGMTASEALVFVGRYVGGAEPLETAVLAASRILAVTLTGRKPRVPPGEIAAAKSTTRPDTTGSTSPHSAAPPSSSASVQPPSRRSASTNSKTPSRRGTPSTPTATS